MLCIRHCGTALDAHWCSLLYGGPSPSTGAKQTTQKSGFFVAFLPLSDPVAMPLCYAYDTAEPHWTLTSSLLHGGLSPRENQNKSLTASVFCCTLLLSDPVAMPLCYAYDTAEPHWAFRSCVQARSRHYISGWRVQ